jgi:Tfp pilus assembly protein PilN
MIRINLLPEEFRRSERTSTKIFAAMLVAVIAVCSAFGWFGLTYFGDLGELEARHRQLDDQLASLKDRCTYCDALETEKAEYEKRSSTITEIAQSRMLWTDVLDQVFDVVNNDGNTDRHMTWFKSIQVQKGDAARGPTVQMPGAVQGKEIKRVNDFFDDIEAARFFQDVGDRSPPGATRDSDPKRNPPEALGFNLKFTFKSPKDWARNQKTARPAGR